MTTSLVLPALAAAAFLVYAITAASTRRGEGRACAWWAPAALSSAFLCFSLYAVASTGAFGFWAEHARNAWGNQIWFDLLIGVGVAWYLIVPRARAAGMRPYPWLGLVVLTGGIGLLAMLSRLLWLQRVASGTPTAGRSTRRTAQRSTAR